MMEVKRRGFGTRCAGRGRGGSRGDWGLKGARYDERR